jgi:DNA topoisomerase-1
MEQELDDVAEGKISWTTPLREFYFGEKSNGIAERVTAAKADAPFPFVDLGGGVTVRFGRKGPFLAKGPEGETVTADVPQGVPPADLTVEKAEELLKDRAEWTPDEGRALGTDEQGNAMVLLVGRYGPYIKVEAAKPRNVSLPKDIDTDGVDEALARKFASLPRELGASDGEVVTAAIGPYGPYIKRGKDYRNLDSWREILDIDIEKAEVIFAQPKTGRAAGKSEVKDLGDGIKVMKGRFGPYVTDGNFNATLPKGTDPEGLDIDQAKALLEKNRAAGPTKPNKRRRKPA